MVATSKFCPGCGLGDDGVAVGGDTGLKWTSGDRLRDLDFADYITLPDSTWDYERFNKQLEHRRRQRMWYSLSTKRKQRS